MPNLGQIVNFKRTALYFQNTPTDYNSINKRWRERYTKEIQTVFYADDGGLFVNTCHTGAAFYTGSCFTGGTIGAIICTPIPEVVGGVIDYSLDGALNAANYCKISETPFRFQEFEQNGIGLFQGCCAEAFSKVGAFFGFCIGNVIGISCFPIGLITGASLTLVCPHCVPERGGHVAPPFHSME